MIQLFALPIIIMSQFVLFPIMVLNNNRFFLFASCVSFEFEFLVYFLFFMYHSLLCIACLFFVQSPVIVYHIPVCFTWFLLTWPSLSLTVCLSCYPMSQPSYFFHVWTLPVYLAPFFFSFFFFFHFAPLELLVFGLPTWFWPLPAAAPSKSTCPWMLIDIFELSLLCTLCSLCLWNRLWNIRQQPYQIKARKKNPKYRFYNILTQCHVKQLHLI